MPRESRGFYENMARLEGLPTFQISDSRPHGQLAKASDRAEYFPVFFVEPLKTNRRVLGYDLASDPIRLETMRRSTDSGEMELTNRLVMVNPPGNHFGVLVFRPYYHGGSSPAHGLETVLEGESSQHPAPSGHRDRQVWFGG